MSDTRPNLAPGSDEHVPDGTGPAAGAAPRSSTGSSGIRAAVLAGAVMAAAGATDLLLAAEKIGNSTCCWPPIGS